MKRFECTVGDKRGRNGDCMRQSKTGRYVEFCQADRWRKAAESYQRDAKETERAADKFKSQRDELLAALNEIASTVHDWSNGDAAYMAGIAKEAIAKINGSAS